MQRTFRISLIVSLFAISSYLPAEAVNQNDKRTEYLLKHSIVLDTHVDTTQRLIWNHIDLGNRSSEGSIDIPRMREGSLNAVFFSIWTPGTVTGEDAIKQAMTQIDAIQQQIRLHPNDLVLCTSADEIRAATAHGKIAILMGMEGGHMINNNLKLLKKYAKLGVRYITLTHTLNNDWADSSSDVPKHNGLTDFGKEVVREMNRLGMMIDISHVSDKTFYDALAVSRAPIIASHSSCRSICSSERNMTDDMIKTLAAKGGVIQINYFMSFLSQAFQDAADQSDELKKLKIKLQKKCGNNQSCMMLGGKALIHKMVDQGKLPKVGWEEIIDHIDHVVKLVGADHVGLGSDFDGAIMPYGMEDVSSLPKITEALLERGYSGSDIKKILGGNILRVMKIVEETSKKLNVDDK